MSRPEDVFRLSRTKWQIGPTEWERDEYETWARAHPDSEPVYAVLPVREWGATVHGGASMNTTVRARTAEEATRLAVEGFQDDTLVFDEPMWAGLDAAVEEYEPEDEPA